MSQLVDKIKVVQGLYSGSPASEQEVAVAESKLQLIFPAEYKDYLKEYGVISFYGTEWNGLKGDTWTDVVATTLEARGYQGGEGRTKYRVLEWKLPDTCAVIVMILLGVTLYVLKSA